MKTKTAFLNIFFLSVVIVTFLSNSVWAKVTGPCGAWIRYPSDAALPETYAYTVYEPLAPVARPDLNGYSGAKPNGDTWYGPRYVSFLPPGARQSICEHAQMEWLRRR